MKLASLLFCCVLATTIAASAQSRPVAVVHHQVSTNVAAQAAFDRGLLDLYAYNPEAAEHEFYTAADLDPNMAMAWWGVAQSNAPNINVDPTDDRDAQARQAIKTAKKLESYATPEDRELIDAAAARFDGAKDAKPDALLATYADALKVIAQANPADPDVASLYAESALYVAAGAYHSSYGESAEAIASDDAKVAAVLPIFQAHLAKFPKHIGLLHFYIHAAQMAGQSAAAVSAATQLAAFALPNEDSHLTHMPGHIFLDVGMYDAGLDTSRRSVAMDFADFACCHPGYYSATRYYHRHNIAFLLYALTETGHTGEAVAVAKRERDNGLIGRALLADHRYNDVVALPYHSGGDASMAFARGVSFAKLGDLAQAEEALSEMPAADDSNEHGAIVDAMRHTLGAEIAVLQKDDNKALEMYSQASTLASAARKGGGESPALYFYSPNMAWAALALQLGKPDVARTAYTAELALSPKSPAALAGLVKL